MQTECQRSLPVIVRIGGARKKVGVRRGSSVLRQEKEGAAKVAPLFPAEFRKLI